MTDEQERQRMPKDGLGRGILIQGLAHFRPTEKPHHIPKRLEKFLPILLKRC
jgi:hypothetical protein